MAEKLVFFGNERLGTGLPTDLPVLTSVHAAGYEIAAIIVAQNPPAKSRKARPLEVAEFAEQHNIPLLVPTKLREAADEIKKFGAEAAVLAAFGKIVPESIINLFPKGIINIHPSLLPLHRGPTPIESAILNGDAETGVSLMKLAPAMDAGPVYAQETVLLTGEETKPTLAAQLASIGRDMLLHYLPDILDGSLQPTPQDDAQATYDQLISKSDSVLTFDKPVEVLERQIRGFAGWPRTKTEIGAQEVIITRAHVEDGKGAKGAFWVENGRIGFYAPGGRLVIDALIPSGRKEMSAHDFLLGYKP